MLRFKTINKGFSLLELLIALVIISIISLGVLYGFNKNFASRKLENSASVLKIQLMALQDKAIITGNTLSFSTIPHANRYSATIKRVSNQPIVFHPQGYHSPFVIELVNPSAHKYLISHGGSIEISDHA